MVMEAAAVDTTAAIIDGVIFTAVLVSGVDAPDNINVMI